MTASLNSDQQKCIDAIERGENVFLTGKAGTGKSFVISEVARRFDVDITATTGVAASIVGGFTINTWAGIGIGDKPASRLIGKHSAQKHIPDTPGWRICNATRLVIDEISMLPWHTFQLLHEVMRAVRGQYDKPFGGVQLILCGDFLQLPPVNKRSNLNCVLCGSKPSVSPAGHYVCKDKKYDGCLPLVWESTVRFPFEDDPTGTNLWDYCNFTFVELTQVRSTNRAMYITAAYELR